MYEQSGLYASTSAVGRVSHQPDMLFCFGLFALLLYNTVVANAECSYTYRNSSQQHIEAQSSDYEEKGFRRCEFLIQLGDPQQQIELNFTRLSGFGTHNATEDGMPEGPIEEKEEKEEERPRSSGRSGGGRGDKEQDPQAGSKESGGLSSHHHVLIPTTTMATRTLVLGSKLSSIVSSPVPPEQHQPQQHSPTHSTHAYANTNASSDFVAETPSLSLQRTTTTVPGQSGGGGVGNGPCLPMVEIREVTVEGQERMRHRICREHHNTKTPIVFHYASSVRIVYEWKQKESSGFTLYFDFSSSEYEKCVHKCDGSRCLTELGLLCNGHPDCRDRSDEGFPACPLTTPEASSGSLDAGHLVQIVVIPTSVLVVGVVVCVVCLLARHHHHHHHHHHRWSSGAGGGGVGGAPSSSSSPSADLQPHHLLHHHHHHQLRGNGHATAVHLDYPQSHSSEGLMPSGCSSQECSNEQAVALLSGGSSSAQQHPRSHYNNSKHPSWYPPAPAPPPAPHPTTTTTTTSTTGADPEVGLPPNIPVSPDGEEGYSASQLRLLDRRFRAASNYSSELFKPPPNKTVFDRESPPPYTLTASSPGTGVYGCGSPLAPPPPPPSPPASVGRGGYLSSEVGGSCPERVIRDSEGQPVVSRCYTMFSGPAAPPRRSFPRGGGAARQQQFPPPALPRLQAAPGSRRDPRHQLPSSSSLSSSGVVSSITTDCDPPPPSLPSPPPRVFGALTTAGDVRRPFPSSSSSPSGDLPLPSPPSSQSMPSQTITSSSAGWSPSLGVDVGSPEDGGDRDTISSDCRNGVGGPSTVERPAPSMGASTTSRGSPPSYQMVLSQDLMRDGVRRDGVGSGGGVGGSPRGVASSSALVSPASSSPSLSPSPSTTTSSTSMSTFNNNNNSQDPSGV